MRIENEFILELCKFEYASKEKLLEFIEVKMDYPYVLGNLLYNRVGAMAYYVLKQNELLYKVNREFRNTLKAIYEYNIYKTNSFTKALKMLMPLCEKIEFPYAFLKGAYLIELYPKGVRTSNDIDILIDQKNITQMSGILKDFGFKQGGVINETMVPASRREIISSRMNRGETVPFIKEVNLPNMKYLEIDVNFSLGFRPGSDTGIVCDFLRGAKGRILEQIPTLNQVDFLMHLCAHLYKEAAVMTWVEMGRDISLYKYCDIYLFVKKIMDENFANNLIKRINDVGLNKECYFALHNTKELFGISNCHLDRVLKEIQMTDTSFMRQILEPETGKVYYYSMNYVDWIFCSNRRRNLHEARNVEK